MKCECSATFSRVIKSTVKLFSHKSSLFVIVNKYIFSEEEWIKTFDAYDVSSHQWYQSLTLEQTKFQPFSLSPAAQDQSFWNYTYINVSVLRRNILSAGLLPHMTYYQIALQIYASLSTSS